MDFTKSILDNSSKSFCIYAEISKGEQAQILPPSPENPLGVDGFAFLQSERIRFNPAQFIKSNNLYILHKWKISHNLANANLGAYAAAYSPSWNLYNNTTPILYSAIPFSDTQENEMFVAFKPNTDNPDLSMSISALFNSASPDFLEIKQMRIGLRYTCYEISDDTIVNEWLKRKGL